jgi:hypothetical protein
MLCAYKHDSQRDRRGRDRLVVTCATDTYHHYSIEFKSRSWRCVHYVIEFVSDLIAKDRWSVVFSGYCGFLHQ